MTILIVDDKNVSIYYFVLINNNNNIQVTVDKQLFGFPPS